MGKKKKSKQPEKLTTVNNIEQLNLEIDYDKLAYAIIRAAKQAEAPKKSSSKVRSIAMKFFNGFFYSSIYVASVTCIHKIWTKWYVAEKISYENGILFSVLLFVVSVFAFFSQQETFNDKERDVFAHFNTNISLIALIVALIALFKGVG